MTTRKFAEIFPPGEFIKDELEARDWSQIELAEIIGRQPSVISELIVAKRAISPELAKELAATFETSAEYWMNLENAYQLWKAKETDSAITMRAQIYKKAPVKEMIKRHWLESSENVQVLATRVAQFFEITGLDKEIKFSHASRKSTQEITSYHYAWFYRAKKLAQGVHAKEFSNKSFKEGLNILKDLLSNTQDVRQVPRVLADSGIRFLIVEHLPRTKIDGVTFWLDHKSPVIVLSMRLDRIDSFWFTLAHELAHVARQDGLKTPLIFDTDLVDDSDLNDNRNEAEKEADLFATEFLVDPSELTNFILRFRPLYSRQKIINFAARLKVHPGIVVGQLHHRKEFDYKMFRPLLEKVKHLIIPSALTDGWGEIPVYKEV